SPSLQGDLRSPEVARSGDRATTPPAPEVARSGDRATTPPALLAADRRGYTHDEYERLRKPGGLRFAPVRWLMKGPGRLSRGIAIGCKHGFDSGVMLDYIYQNLPQGLTPLGRLID